MSFQFVNTNANKRKPDEKTRRKIRSQVMKDYRRRRDVDTDPVGSSTRASSMASRSPRPPLSRTQSGQHSRPGSPGELATPPGEVLGERSAKRGRPAKSQRLQAASLFVQTAHGLFANFTVNMPARPEPEVASPVIADAEKSRMLEICAKYDEWLGNEQSSAAKLPSISGLQDEEEATMQLCARTMKAIGHLHAIGVFQGEDERSYYKTRLLGIANKLLKDPSKALEDSTLSALACLTSYEISFNSHEALTHLIGISRIIDSRGGLDGIGGDVNLTMMLQGLDLSHALFFNTEPVFTTTFRAASSSGRTFEDGPRQGSSGGSVDDALSEEQVRRWQDTLGEAASFLRDNGSPEPSRACYLAWRIHVFQPRSTAEWSAESITEMDEMFHLMTSMPGDAWERYPALQVRVILTALVTAVEIIHKSWYYTQLSRLMFHTHANYWDDFMNLVAGFIELQAYFRHPVMQTVKAVVSGVEIDVERSLAEQMGLEIVRR